MAASRSIQQARRTLLQSPPEKPACRHLSPEFWPPELQDNTFLLFQATEFVLTFPASTES